jgi:hypothetical protein
MSNTVPAYKAFHRTIAACADGSEVACGWLTMGTKHAPDLARLSPGQVADQYDHTGTLGAKIRCSNGQYGVWASGAVLPGLEERELAIIQGPEVSGDWRRWQDPDTGNWHGLELLGVLGVPFPAFPGTRIRPELLVASGGEIIAQTGQMLPCDPPNVITAAGSPADHEYVDANGDGKCDVCGMPADAHPKAMSAQEITALANAAMDLIEDGVVFDANDPPTLQERAAYAAKDIPAEFGMYDGSFGVGDLKDLRMAIRLVNANPSYHRAIRQHVIGHADRLGRSDMVPENWAPDGTIVEVAEIPEA